MAGSRVGGTMSPLLTEQMGFQVAGLPVVGLPVARLPVAGQPQGRSLFAARYLNLRHRTDRKAKSNRCATPTVAPLQTGVCLLL